MVRKKQTEIKPVVARPLNDKENKKRSIVSNFLNTTVKEPVKGNATKDAAKKTKIIKTIVIGKKEIKASFETNEKCRPNYSLSKETIEKIEKVSDLLGYKKAEFLDIYLNGTLTNILKKLEK